MFAGGTQSLCGIQAYSLKSGQQHLCVFLIPWFDFLSCDDICCYAGRLDKVTGRDSNWLSSCILLSSCIGEYACCWENKSLWNWIPHCDNTMNGQPSIIFENKNRISSEDSMEASFQAKHERPFREVFNEFGDTTTFHGLRYVTNNSNHYFRRLVSPKNKTMNNVFIWLRL